MSSEGGIESIFVDELLALQTREQQMAFLRDAGLLNADGLNRLLDVADELLGIDPRKAQLVAELGACAADGASSPASVPRAAYIRVQTHNANGEFDAALRMTRLAHDGYSALGERVEALRTNVGKMAVLLDLGRYRETLDVGYGVLDVLDSAGKRDLKITQSQSDLLAAMVHQNLGLCFEYVGRYEDALDAYEKAERSYRNLGMTERLGEILDNRGAVLSSLGRGTEALVAHKAAAEIFEASGLTLPQVMSLGNIGETHIKLANYVDGLNSFEEARRVSNSLETRADEYLLLRDTADAYFALNLYAEALAAYREANARLQKAGMVHDRARALWGMGATLIARMEFEEAEEVLAEAATLFAAADNLPMLSGVMLEQASLLAASEDHTTALETALRALDLVSVESWPVQQVYARLRVADLSLPDAAAAEPHLLAARRLVDDLMLPQLRYRLNERLGHLRRLQNLDAQAQTLLEAAVDEIERLRGSVAQDTMRVSFLRDKSAAYEDLMLLHLDRGDEESIRRAFAVAERAKSRALVDLLTGVAEKESSESADLERRTLQADLNAVYSELLGGGDSERPAPLSNLHARAARLEQEMNRLRLQAAARGPTHDPFGESMQQNNSEDQLPSDVVLLAYHIVGGEIMAFVSGHGSIKVERVIATADKTDRLLHKLSTQWERFRAGREFAGRHMDVLERSTRQVLSALYDELVAPLESLLEEAASSIPGESDSAPRLAIVPHGSLHQVPFHALFDGERYLLERYEISYAPSATVYALCQERASRDSGRALVFGAEDPLIPAAVSEARSVARSIKGAESRVGEEATVAALQGEASGCRVLHLACHGLFRTDNPIFSSLKLHDGWLTAAQALSLNLPGTLVTLSACESGRGGVIGGDEVLGLTRAFLGAGAATLVVSLWLVQDGTTAELMGKYYERLRDHARPAQALRDAQLDLKERYAHPYYWAPFVLIGKH